jgi:hypothetical protein
VHSYKVRSEKRGFHHTVFLKDSAQHVPSDIVPNLSVVPRHHPNIGSCSDQTPTEAQTAKVAFHDGRPDVLGQSALNPEQNTVLQACEANERTYRNRVYQM